jgi:choline dehydrogenase-like flavoprotein
MKRAIVVGSGAGAATAAKELQGRFAVTVLEAGREFQRLTLSLATLEKVKRTGLLFDEVVIRFVFPQMRVRKSTEGMLLVNGVGLGGSTTVCTGNGLRMDQDLRALGIDLDAEFDEVYREIPISTAHQQGWRETTRRLFDICADLDLEPRPAPKMGDYERCVHCGRCVFGCPQGVKWDSRKFLQAAIDRGACVETGCRVEKVEIEDGKAIGVQAKRGMRRRFYPADLVVLGAGGFETPIILQNSGIPCEPHLFVDPVLWVAGRAENAEQCYEVEMPFIIQREGFILSPYFDHLSFFFNRAAKYPARDTVGMMIKLADMNQGSVSAKGIQKPLSAQDESRLHDGVALCQEVLERFGVDGESIFLGTINGGHPGGALPLTEREADSFHDDRLPANLYVADATLIPRALGNPPILTIVAIAKRVSQRCIETAA